LKEKLIAISLETEEEQLSFVQRVEIIQKRICAYEEQLKQYSKEYRDMKWMGITLDKLQYEQTLRSMEYQARVLNSEQGKQQTKSTKIKDTGVVVEKQERYER